MPHNPPNIFSYMIWYMILKLVFAIEKMKVKKIHKIFQMVIMWLLFCFLYFLHVHVKTYADVSMLL